MERNDRSPEGFHLDLAVLALALLISGGLAALIGLTIAVF